MPTGYRSRANWNFVAMGGFGLTRESAARANQAIGTKAATARQIPAALQDFWQVRCCCFPSIICFRQLHEHLFFHSVYDSSNVWRNRAVFGGVRVLRAMA